MKKIIISAAETGSPIHEDKKLQNHVRKGQYFSKKDPHIDLGSMPIKHAPVSITTVQSNSLITTHYKYIIWKNYQDYLAK